MQAPEHTWSERIALELVKRLAESRNTTVTWLNHHSARLGIHAAVNYAEFDMVGVDGQFLRRILGGKVRSRTSADLVLPIVLSQIPGRKVAVIGSAASNVAALERLLSDRYAEATFEVFDGYAGRPSPEDVAEAGYDMAVVGLGAPLQDDYALELSRLEGRPTLVVTCGGWLDQVVNPRYYPAWAYRFRANWLIRLMAEPRRLLHRYTTGAHLAVRMRGDLRPIGEIDAVLLHESVAERQLRDRVRTR